MGSSMGSPPPFLPPIRPPCAPPPHTGFLHHVGNPTRAVLAVLEGDLSFARPFHRDGQTPGARLAGPDAELGCGAQGGGS